MDFRRIDRIALIDGSATGKGDSPDAAFYDAQTWMYYIGNGGASANLPDSTISIFSVDQGKLLDQKFSVPGNNVGKVAHFPAPATLKKTLEKFSSNLLRVALSPDQISLIRMISMESGRCPELARRFYLNGPKRGEDALSAYLGSQVELGQLRKEDPLTMARHLTGSPVRWSVLGSDTEILTEVRLKRHIRESVDVFLRAYQLGIHTPRRTT